MSGWLPSDYESWLLGQVIGWRMVDRAGVVAYTPCLICQLADRDGYGFCR